MNYQEFLQRFGEQDSPGLRQAYEEQFGGSENLGLSSPTEIAERGVHGRLMSNPNEVLYGTEGQEGKNFLVATDRYHNPNEFQLSGALENWEEPPENPWAMPVGGTDNFPARPTAPPEEFLSHPFFEPGEPNISPGLLSSAPKDYSVAELQALDIGSGAETGLSAAEIAVESEAAVTAAEEGLLALEAGESAWGGPATIAGNMALSMIPTLNKKKTKTPFGEEGSASGILKGAGKGALLGATIGSAFPVIGTGVGALIGGGLGVVGGSQGYFDSTSAPQMMMSSIKRRGGGMQGGLLGGGSMYG
jgi:hypothetical protein